jgi:hypothetical protein
MNVCQKCGQTAAPDQKFCPRCGSQLTANTSDENIQSSELPPTMLSFSPSNQYGQPSSSLSNPNAQPNFEQPPPNFAHQPATAQTKNNRSRIYIALGIGALGILFLLLAAAGGGLYWYANRQIVLSERLPEQVANYRRGNIETTVSQDLKKDSVEALVATYKSADGSLNNPNVTYVVVRYPSKTLAQQALTKKVQDMKSGIAKATVTEAGTKYVGRKPVGLRTWLNSAILEQIVWTEDEDFMLVTSTKGAAIAFEKNLLAQ